MNNVKRRKISVARYEVIPIPDIFRIKVGISIPEFASRTPTFYNFQLLFVACNLLNTRDEIGFWEISMDVLLCAWKPGFLDS